MAKGVFNASVFTGRPLYPANVDTLVTVYDAETGEPVPTLWRDRDGVEELSNPHGLSEDGVILFYANPGRYHVEASRPGFLREWPDVIILDTATGGGGGGGGIESVVAGDAIDVDSTDPANPIVSFDGGITDVTGLQTALDAKQDIRNTVTAVTSSSGVVTINYALGDYFTLALSENVTSWSFTNLPGSGKGASIMIRITQDSTARTVAWPASFAFTYGSEESVPVGSGDVALLAISTLDNGTNWFATMASEA